VTKFFSGQNKPYWPPANLLGDFGGGGLTCAFGICAALIKLHKTGQGSIIDLSMTEGTAYLASYIYSYQANEQFWDPSYGFFSGNCPVYRTFETSDGKFMSCGALEPKFHGEVFKVLEINPSEGTQKDLMQKMEAKFKTKTRDEWQKIFES
jgi:alpha-methylacyl-CoA racemase